MRRVVRAEQTLTGSRRRREDARGNDRQGDDAERPLCVGDLHAGTGACGDPVERRHDGAADDRGRAALHGLRVRPGVVADHGDRSDVRAERQDVTVVLQKHAARRRDLRREGTVLRRRHDRVGVAVARMIERRR